MRVLILHDIRFTTAKYDLAIDHEAVEVCYAGTDRYLRDIPPQLRRTEFRLEEGVAALPQLRTWLANQPRFDCILTRQERMLIVAATLRAEFNIPGMRPEIALLFRDKVSMKAAVAASGIRVPLHVRIGEKLDSLPWDGETILKPVDASGSRGVLRFPFAAAALAHVNARGEERPEEIYSGAYELEEFVQGPIWHVDGYLHRGEAIVLTTNRYVGTCLDYTRGEPLGSVQYDNPALAHWALGCLAALGVDTVTFHLEAILSETGPVFLEVAGRAGGAGVVEAVELSTGINLNVLDMNTEVAGALPAWAMSPRPNSKKCGWFLLPGHQLKGAPCRVLGVDALLGSPLVETVYRLSEASPTPTDFTYQVTDVPLAGTVSSESSEAVEAWMRGLFGAARIVAANGG